MIARSTLIRIAELLRDYAQLQDDELSSKDDESLNIAIELEAFTAPLEGTRLICHCEECRELRKWYLS